MYSSMQYLALRPIHYMGQGSLMTAQPDIQVQRASALCMLLDMRVCALRMPSRSFLSSGLEMKCRVAGAWQRPALRMKAALALEGAL